MKVLIIALLFLGLAGTGFYLRPTSSPIATSKTTVRQEPKGVTTEQKTSTNVVETQKPVTPPESKTSAKPTSSTYVAPETPKVCNQSQYDAWIALRDSTEASYQANLTAAEVKSASRLEAKIGDLQARGLGFSGQVQVVTEQEAVLLAQDKANITSASTAQYQTVLSRKPVYCP